MKRILIVGLCDGSATPFDGKYVLEYDPTRPGVSPDGEAMIAHLRVTEDPNAARQFQDAGEALAFWKLAHGLRPDGAPNRPLTAFTVEIL
jgi:hypothetical protein